MLKIRNLTGAQGASQKDHWEGLAMRWLLITTITIIVLAGLAVGVARGASLKPQENSTEGGGMDIWVVQRVDYSRSFWNMSPRSMALDSSNRMHVAYGGEHLYHAYFDGNTWQTEMVDGNSYVGQYASIATSTIMGVQHIYISYYDAMHGTLKYAHKFSGGGWDITTVDMPSMIGTMGEEAAPIVVDQDALPESKSWLNPVFKINGIDEVTVPGGVTNEMMGMYSSIDIDSSGNPHIAYLHRYIDPGSGETRDKLKYASFNGIIWTTETVQQDRTDYKEGKFTALYIDNADRPHISFLEDDHDNLRYVYKEGNNWRFAYPDEGGNVGGYTSIYVDSSFKVHISYCQGPLVDNFCVKLKYVTAKVSDDRPEDWTWSKTTIESNYTGTYSSISKGSGSKGKVAISYYDWDKHKLKLAVLGTGGWDTDSFDIEGDHGLYTSLAFDNNNYIHIAFQDLQDGFYKEIYWNNTEKEYFSRNIDWQKDVGLSSSLALDSLDKAHISYMDDTSDDLKYATNTSGVWATSIISATGNVGVYSSIAVDAANAPHVAYYDIDGGDLEYATLSGSSWITTTVDHPGDDDDHAVNTGLYPDIAISPVSNLPYISYYDATNANLMLATYDGSSWISYTVDGGTLGSYVGKYNSIDMDTAGHIYISYFDEKYYDGDTMRLKFAYWTGSAWMIRTVDYSDNVGYYTSIDYDDLGQVHIAYYDANNRALKYALGVLSGGDWVWTIDMVDDDVSDDYDVGKYASIGATSTGEPYISYYDTEYGNLKVAHKTGGAWVIQTVDSEGDVGRFTSLDIDSLDYPHISYYDNSFGDLKYAYLTDPPAMQVFVPLIIK